MEVVFQHRGRKLATAGKLRKSLDVYRDLLRRFPNRPTYHRQLANAFGYMGFGLKARAMLRRATQRFSKDAYTHFVLGIYLENDGFGNRHAPGWDHAGVKKAYRRACELDPKHVGYLTNYARILSLDKRGRFLRDAKALAPAVRAFRRLRTQLKHKKRDLAYAWVLIRGRQLATLRAELPGLKIPTLRRGLDVALHVAKKGVAGALPRARQLAGGATRVPRVLLDAALLLLELGRYRAGAKLLGELNRLAGGNHLDPARLKRIRSYAHLDRATPTPGSLVLRLLRLVVAERLTASVLRRDLASKRLSAAGQKKMLKGFTTLAAMARGGKGFLASLSPVAAADLFLADLKPKVEGDDKLGYYVKVVSLNTRRPVYKAYVVKEGGAYRIRASWGEVEEMGVEALARLKRGDVKGARKWLDWLRGRKDAPMAPYDGTPFLYLWEAGVRHSPKHTWVAAAVVATQSADHRAGALKILERALARRPDRERRIQILRTLRTTYRKLDKFRAAARTMGRLWKMSHRARQLLLPYIADLLAARKLRQAHKVAKRYHKRHPTRWQGGYSLALVANARRRFAEAKKQYDALLAKEGASGLLYNNRAWLGLFLKPFNGKEALKLAKRASTLTRGRSASALDTLAVIHAEMGQLGAARKAFRKNLALLGWKKPKNHSWYVHGRIAEQLGLLVEARAAYKKVKKPKQPDPTHTYELAQRRLKQMPATPPRPAPGRRRNGP